MIVQWVAAILMAILISPTRGLASRAIITFTFGLQSFWVVHQSVPSLADPRLRRSHYPSRHRGCADVDVRAFDQRNRRTNRDAFSRFSVLCNSLFLCRLARPDSGDDCRRSDHFIRGVYWAYSVYGV